jgi:spermidine/putrescine transport system permease protein
MNPRLLVPPTAWLLVFLLAPTAVVAAAGVSAEGLRAFTDADTLRLLGRSLRIATISTALCLLLGYPVAWFIAGCTPRWRNLLLFLVVLPFWTNLLVRTYSLMFLLRPMGLLYTETSVILGLVHGYLPFMILPLYQSIEKLPRRLLEASQDLGATPWTTFWRVSVPLTMPGIGAGCILVFIPVLGAFATPELLGGSGSQMLGNQIHLFALKTQNRAAASALTLVLLLVTIALTALYQRFRKTEGIV